MDGHILQLLTLNRHLNHLIQALILRNIKIILIRHLGAQEPATKEMSPSELLNQRLRCSQADESWWHEALARSRVLRPVLDIPR